MGIADDVKKLGEDIVASHDVRVKALRELVADTCKTLRGFAQDHKEMATKQAVSLSNFVKDLTKNVGPMLKGFHASHKEMSEAQSESLEKGETDRLKAFKGMMGDIDKGIKDIETYVAKKLKEFSAAHADMSVELKKDLAKYVDDMVKETKKLMSGIQARQKERNAQVADLLEAYKTEREKMAANWQATAATMAKRRGGKPVVSAGAEVKTVEEAVEKPKKKAKRKAEKRDKYLTPLLR